jgi:hypothetical protein
MRRFLLSTLLLAPLACGTGAPLPGPDAGADLARSDALPEAADLATPPPPDLAMPASPDLGGTICGGFANIPCPNGFFCEIDDLSCGAADQSGHCLPRPQACDKVYSPVCGCDGMTYGNDCERQAAGVALHYEGICGCATPCPVGEYCVQCKLAPTCMKKGSICD